MGRQCAATRITGIENILHPAVDTFCVVKQRGMGAKKASVTGM